MLYTRHVDTRDMDKLSNAPLRWVRTRAEAGDAAAQTEFARRLARRRKSDEALHWFRSAARGADPERQMELGIVLFWDHDAYSEGLKWVRRAAVQGHVGAQYFLGAELATGEKVRKNLREAASWYRRAAKQNHGEAQYNLALMYWGGEGLHRSASAARKWLESAARLDDLLALRALAEAYECGQFGYLKDAVRARRWRRRYDRVNKKAFEVAASVSNTRREY